ncbi:uncharacterized protein LOC124787654 [Schistocerca piceifrons]|uniref:uncharacterized protein LOC124787654 n=1 Tax=Schistocerca piceifrons TaxID=274613 RepID=UPI001F5F7EAD|nr:uncharacterized protein LOC124787654 [Schistocerca piceifrons]XP_047110411.1 uncharacterized protein LOC124787654 [Schistocerca piceifrons]
MAYYRRNTLRCEFAGGADRPTEREVHRWVRTQLRVPDAELKALQLHTQHAVAFLKLRSDAAFLQLAERLCGGAALQLQSGKLTPVRVSVADDDGGVEVRVFDVPLEVPDAEFRRALAPYGKVVHTSTGEMPTASWFEEDTKQPVTDVVGSSSGMKCQQGATWFH